MAEFCKQCSIEIFGKDFEELKDLGNGKPLPKDHGWLVICEGCGPVIVDNDGVCMGNCLKNHTYEEVK